MFAGAIQPGRSAAAPFLVVSRPIPEAWAGWASGAQDAPGGPGGYDPPTQRTIDGIQFWLDVWVHRQSTQIGRKTRSVIQ